MKVKDLIRKLEAMPQDAEIAVAYRDDGGCYPGCDYRIEPYVKDENCCDKSIPDGVVLL